MDTHFLCRSRTESNHFLKKEEKDKKKSNSILERDHLEMGDGSRSHSICFVHNQSGISDIQCESQVNGSYESMPILHSSSPAYTSPSR